LSSITDAAVRRAATVVQPTGLSVAVRQTVNGRYVGALRSGPTHLQHNLNRRCTKSVRKSLELLVAAHVSPKQHQPSSIQVIGKATC
jgi:hypothetical protein